MEKIASFQIDHLRLNPGVYVSRSDRFGDTAITTFDLRFKAPNKEPVMGIAEMHTIEHLGATFLRSHGEWAARIVYFGPMGCRTGFYLIVEGDRSSREVLPLLREMLAYAGGFEGSIPGASAIECGNWQDQDLAKAKAECCAYAALLENPGEENLSYPA